MRRFVGYWSPWVVCTVFPSLIIFSRSALSAAFLSAMSLFCFCRSLALSARQDAHRAGQEHVSAASASEAGEKERERERERESYIYIEREGWRREGGRGKREKESEKERESVVWKRE